MFLLPAIFLLDVLLLWYVEHPTSSAVRPLEPSAVARIVHQVLSIGGEHEAALVCVSMGAVLPALHREEDPLRVAPSRAKRHAPVLGPVTSQRESPTGGFTTHSTWVNVRRRGP